MTQLSHEGQAILRKLVEHMQTNHVVANNPRTFAGYKQIHDALRLPFQGRTYGGSLKYHGLAELAEWTLREGHPAVTGLVVDKKARTPGKGYFELYGKKETDVEWWQREVEKSLAYDWEQFLS